MLHESHASENNEASSASGVWDHLKSGRFYGCRSVAAVEDAQLLQEAVVSDHLKVVDAEAQVKQHKINFRHVHDSCRVSYHLTYT